MDFSALTPFSKPPQQHFMIFSNVDFRRLYTTYIFTVLTKHALFLRFIYERVKFHIILWNSKFHFDFFGADFQFPISGEGGNKGHITRKTQKKKKIIVALTLVTFLPAYLYFFTHDFYFCYSHAVYWYESRAIQVVLI